MAKPYVIGKPPKDEGDPKRRMFVPADFDNDKVAAADRDFIVRQCADEPRRQSGADSPRSTEDRERAAFLENELLIQEQTFSL